MINITLKDGSVIQAGCGKTCSFIASQISAGLARAALAAEVDGHVCDLSSPLTKDCSLNILTFDSPGGRHALRHTASHVLAQAVLRLYPNVKLAIGPAIENGFYYDFDSETSFSPEDLEKIESEMKKIIKEALPVTRFEIPRNEALELMKNEPYKAELIDALPEDAVISFYKQGEFTDLCAGPHIPDTSGIKAIKLTSCTGAYWRGDSKNKVLQRIYGTAFTKKDELLEYLAKIEDAKKRDHNKLGRELSYFTTVDYVGQGLPILMPNGAKVMQILQRFVEDEEERRGFKLTKTPYLAKSDLYKVSGHWQHYRDGMFVFGDDEKGEAFALRPMTCPFQFQVYLSETRSYRDLPLRYNETSTLFRNEASGEMHGLIRVRQFTISEGHIACLPSQLADEFKNCLDLANYFLETLGLKDDVTYRFSKWDSENREKYIGGAEEWESVQAIMKDILDDIGLDYEISAGEAAFYGPKLDIQSKNVHGKEDTLITIQIDFQLAERFGMEYVDSDGSKKYPYVIHRTSIGCYERTLAWLIEKYAGALPLWLSPVQVVALPLTDRNHEYSAEIVKKLCGMGFRVEADYRNEKIGYKIREAQLKKLPYMLVLGDKEEENGLVAVRSRSVGDLGAMPLNAFVNIIRTEIDTKSAAPADNPVKAT